MNLYNALLVGAGGFMGSIARYLGVISIDKRLNSIFPYGTLAVNLLGSLLLGFILASVVKKTGIANDQWRLFIGTGFCGGFTTFSAFAFENLNLLEQKFPGSALVYILMSVAGGILAVWGGVLLGRTLV